MKCFKYILISCFICYACNVYSSHKVYIIHGWANAKSIMNKVCKSVRKSDFVYENYSYPALMVELDSLGSLLYRDVKIADYDSVSFVTHSMGALVLRNMLKYSGKDLDFPVIYRIVMITPPNQGADIADLFKSKRTYQKLLGPNVEKMETDSNSYANQLPVPINCEIGIIIGIRGKEIGYNPFIEGDNDGLISPEHTLLGNEKDTIKLKLDHLRVIKKRKARKQIIFFLNYGEFKHDNVEKGEK